MGDVLVSRGGHGGAQTWLCLLAGRVASGEPIHPPTLSSLIREMGPRENTSAAQRPDTSPSTPMLWVQISRGSEDEVGLI